MDNMFQETVEGIVKVKTERKLKSYLDAMQTAARVNGPAPSYDNPLGTSLSREQLEAMASGMRPYFTEEATNEVMKNLWEVLSKDR